MIKFPTLQGTCTIRGCRQVAWDCNDITTQRTRARFEVLSLQGTPKPTDRPDDPRDRVMAHAPVDLKAMIEDIQLFPDLPKRTMKVRSQLYSALKQRIIDFLRKYSKVFACSYADMPRIDPAIISHKLNQRLYLYARKGEYLMTKNIK